MTMEQVSALAALRGWCVVASGALQPCTLHSGKFRSWTVPRFSRVFFATWPAGSKLGLVDIAEGLIQKDARTQEKIEPIRFWLLWTVWQDIPAESAGSLDSLSWICNVYGWCVGTLKKTWSSLSSFLAEAAKPWHPRCDTRALRCGFWFPDWWRCVPWRFWQQGEDQGSSYRRNEGPSQAKSLEHSAPGLWPPQGINCYYCHVARGGGAMNELCWIKVESKPNLPNRFNSDRFEFVTHNSHKSCCSSHAPPCPHMFPHMFLHVPKVWWTGRGLNTSRRLFQWPLAPVLLPSP